MKVFMKEITTIIRRYPLSSLCIAGIWVLCLIPIPETPLDGVALIDKWTHFVFYGGLCAVMWAEYGHRHAAIDKKKTFVWMVIAPVVMGGLIEVVQATCTGGNRSGDVMDWVADAVGVAIGQLIGIPLALYLSKKSRD